MEHETPEVAQQPVWTEVNCQRALGGLVVTRLYHEDGSETDTERALAETYPEGHPYHGVGNEGPGGLQSGNYMAKVKVLGFIGLTSRTTITPKS